MSFAYMTALELKGLLAERSISPVELVEDTLSRQDALEPQINAFVNRTPEQALAAAREAERAIAAGEGGAIAGLPVSVKDLVPVAGVPWTFGSRPFADNVVDFDAPSVERIRQAGGCIIGKSTTSEFGCKAVCDSPLSGITRNPWDLTKTSGGSSGGAGASVAAGLTPFALGTDGGGSVRIPSALCGLFGIKAQFGRVPIFPVSAAPTLAHVGSIARTVRDAALLLGVMAGHDRRDAFGVAEPTPDFLAACDAGAEGLRIAWSPTLGYAQPEPEVAALVRGCRQALRGAGLHRRAGRGRPRHDPVELWMAEFYGGIGTKLKDLMAERPDELDPAVVATLSAGLDRSMVEFFTQVFARYEFREQMRQLFERYDLLLSPTLPCAAFDVGHDTPPGLGARNIVSWVYYTYPFNLTGQPAASIPAGFTASGLPVGLQMVAGINREVDILRAAAAFEEAAPWADRRPPLA
ncbi:Putative amidase AF_1954 [Geodia barretti]|uniref:Amidase AF_1954 n=1 Tax=Geodia barretti TaxID=519541 RepID=A0AA35TI26_GEOBA|nr:Putative amidase AF_1954 [Geodia barretti]